MQEQPAEACLGASTVGRSPSKVFYEPDIVKPSLAVKLQHRVIIGRENWL